MQIDIRIHLVWFTKDREPLLTAEYRQQLLSYLPEIAPAQQVELDRIDCETDHIYCLVRLQPGQDINAIAEMLKKKSAALFNRLHSRELEWEEGHQALWASPAGEAKIEECETLFPAVLHGGWFV